MFSVEVPELEELLFSNKAVKRYQFQPHPNPDGRNVPLMMKFPSFQKKPTGEVLSKNRENRENLSPQTIHSWDRQAEIHVQFPDQTAGAIDTAVAWAFYLIERESAEEEENQAVLEVFAAGRNTTIFSTP